MYKVPLYEEGQVYLVMQYHDKFPMMFINLLVEEVVPCLMAEHFFLHVMHARDIVQWLGSSLTSNILYDTRSLGALRAPTSSWRPFGPLDFILRALRALRPVRLPALPCIPFFLFFLLVVYIFCWLLVFSLLLFVCLFGWFVCLVCLFSLFV